jgi:hypothetical protein
MPDLVQMNPRPSDDDYFPTLYDDTPDGQNAAEYL